MQLPARRGSNPDEQHKWQVATKQNNHVNRRKRQIHSKKWECEVTNYFQHDSSKEESPLNMLKSLPGCQNSSSAGCQHQQKLEVHQYLASSGMCLFSKNIATSQGEASCSLTSHPEVDSRWSRISPPSVGSTPLHCRHGFHSYPATSSFSYVIQVYLCLRSCCSLNSLTKLTKEEKK